MDGLPHKLFLAPMAEVSTPALRCIVKEMCKRVVLCSEMLSASAIAAGSAHNEPLVRAHDFDNPIMYQIVGSDAGVMARAAAILSENECYSIDINMGCPNHEIVKRGQGARLLTDFDRAKRIVRACRRATRARLSVKMRSGYGDSDEKRFTDFISMLEQEGVDFITVHPRSARLSFKRTADWHLVGLAKRCVTIPVIGNGDIVRPESVPERMRETGCDGIMIGREGVKSPWIFRLAADLIERGNAAIEVNLREVFVRALDLIRILLPERLHKSRSLRFAFYFSKNAVFGHDLFNTIRRQQDTRMMREVVDAYFDRNGHEEVKKFSACGEPLWE
jgi:tRNA-dihydrouridine synthase B